MLSYFDTHSHQPYSLSTNQLTQLIVATQMTEDFVAVNNASNPHLLFAKGLHPWFVDSAISLNVKSFSNVNISAIGEIGLDYSQRYLQSKVLQLRYFEQQLSIAQELDLPVSIHCRSAFPELLECLKRYSVKGVLHGFMGSVEQAKPFIQLGFKLGVNGVVCNPNARRYHRLITQVPLEHWVLESDYPYVLDQYQKPIGVDQVAHSISERLKIPLEEVTAFTYDTASRLFIRNTREPII